MVLAIIGIVLAFLVVGGVVGFKINDDQVREATIAKEIALEHPTSYGYITYKVPDNMMHCSQGIETPVPSGRIENKFGQVVTRFGKPGVIDAEVKKPGDEPTDPFFDNGYRTVYAPGLKEATFYPDFLSSFINIGFHCSEADEAYSTYSDIYISSNWTGITRATINVKDCYAKIEGWNFRCRLQLLQFSSYSVDRDSVDLDLYSDREINMSRKDEHTVVLTSPGTLAVRQGDNESIDLVRDRVKNVTIKGNPAGKTPTVTFNEPE